MQLFCRRHRAALARGPRATHGEGAGGPRRRHSDRGDGLQRACHPDHRRVRRPRGARAHTDVYRPKGAGQANGAKELVQVDYGKGSPPVQPSSQRGKEWFASPTRRTRSLIARIRVVVRSLLLADYSRAPQRNPGAGVLGTWPTRLARVGRGWPCIDREELVSRALHRRVRPPNILTHSTPSRSERATSRRRGASPWRMDPHRARLSRFARRNATGEIPPLIRFRALRPGRVLFGIDSSVVENRPGAVSKLASVLLCHPRDAFALSFLATLASRSSSTRLLQVDLVQGEDISWLGVPFSGTTKNRPRAIAGERAPVYASLPPKRSPTALEAVAAGPATPPKVGGSERREVTGGKPAPPGQARAPTSTARSLDARNAVPAYTPARRDALPDHEGIGSSVAAAVRRLASLLMASPPVVVTKITARDATASFAVVGDSTPRRLESIALVSGGARGAGHGTKKLSVWDVPA